MDLLSCYICNTSFDEDTYERYWCIDCSFCKKDICINHQCDIGDYDNGALCPKCVVCHSCNTDRATCSDDIYRARCTVNSHTCNKPTCMLCLHQACCGVPHTITKEDYIVDKLYALIQARLSVKPELLCLGISVDLYLFEGISRTCDMYKADKDMVILSLLERLGLEPEARPCAEYDLQCAPGVPPIYSAPLRKDRMYTQSDYPLRLHALVHSCYHSIIKLELG